MSRLDSPIWISPHHSLRGEGTAARFDPGVGQGRYRRSLDWLRSVGAGIAFASFTFDPDEGGSVVLAPESVTAAAPEPASYPIRQMEPFDDGVKAWVDGFEEVANALERGLVQKVVLARQVVLDLAWDGGVDGILVGVRDPNAYLFSIDGLVGASPELLASVVDDRVRSQALAGTAVGDSGLGSVKTDLEHALAAGSVRTALETVSIDLEAEASVVEVGGISHKATSFSARLRPGDDLMEVLAAVHPSAAVAGTPRGAAMEVIRRVEPSSRGRYAGPVGWFDASGNGEFALALRCARIAPRTVTLFAGGGLVAGSTLQTELEETTLKLKPILRALRIELSEDRPGHLV